MKQISFMFKTVNCVIAVLYLQREEYRQLISDLYSPRQGSCLGLDAAGVIARRNDSNLNIIIIIIIIIIIYLTAYGLSPGGSGYYACT